MTGRSAAAKSAAACTMAARAGEGFEAGGRGRDGGLLLVAVETSTRRVIGARIDYACITPECGAIV
jgi:hypothetical protein